MFIFSTKQLFFYPCSENYNYRLQAYTKNLIPNISYRSYQEKRSDAYAIFVIHSTTSTILVFTCYS